MARWSAKALLITGGVLLVGGLIWYARAATVPLIVAALVSTQLIPLVAWLVRHRVPRGLAIAGAMLLLLAVVAGLAWLFTDQLFGQVGGIGAGVSEGVDKAINWLHDNNRWVEHHEDDIRAFLKGILPAAKDAAAGVLNAVLGTFSIVAGLISSALLMFVFVLYFLTGGDAVWRWVRARFAPERREAVGRAGVAAWSAATGYVRGIALVATIDSLFIGLGMLIVGTPHAGTLVLLSFVCLFIPILGAWVSGIVIVLVTLGSQGSGDAVIMAIIILVGQQLDSMFVTPLVYQQTVNLHPIVTLSSVIVGTQLLGIVGAFLAVPMVAIGWAVWNTVEQRPPEGVPEPAAAPD
jgi:predicted PurR-regulated permease PerM